MNKSFLKSSLVVFCLIAIHSCDNQETTSTTKTVEVKTYETVGAQLQPISKTLQLNGELIPYEKASIVSKVTGYIKKVAVDIGQPVSKGQTLAVVDAPEMKFQIAEANSKSKIALSKSEATKANYNRLLTASSTPGAVAPNELDLAKSQMDADMQSYNAAIAAKNSYSAIGGYLIIKAPFSGLVTTRAVNSGDYVTSNGSDLLFEVQNVNLLRLQVPVPEAYTASMLPNNDADFTVSSYPGVSFPAKLVRKSGSLSNNTRSETWEFEVLNKDKKLKAGMFAELQLPLQRPQQGIMLPNSAFVTTQERQFVIRVKDGKAEWVDVKKGSALPHKTEVLGSIQPGDKIVKNANEEIKDGSTIKTK
ncbi:MAG TPA: efflux RND transporter periplasmic adaptor subunit [Flavisolibacter sp.]|nr:efflux RND transporter periplasmic adaptor subunit [Flavisolibacter sp.]